MNILSEKLGFGHLIHVDSMGLKLIESTQLNL